MQRQIGSSSKLLYALLAAFGLLLAYTIAVGWFLFQTNTLLVAAAGILGLLVVLAIFRNPRVGLYLMLAAIPLEAAIRLGTGATVVRIIGTVTLAAWGYHLIRKRASIPAPNSPILAGVILFWAWNILSILWANEPSGPFGADEHTWRLIRLGLFVFLIVSLVQYKRHWRNMAIAIVIGALTALIYGFVIALTSSYTSFRLGYVGGHKDLWGDPNWIAWAFGMAILFAILGARISTGALSRLFVLSIAFLALGMVWTASLSGAIGLALAFGSYALFGLLKSRLRIKKTLLFGALAVLATALLAVMLLQDRLPRIVVIDRVTQSLEMGFEHRRFDLWRLAFEAIGERPIVGHGSGQLRNRIGQMSQEMYDHFGKPPLSHNTFLDIAGDLGLVGLAAFLLLLLGPTIAIALRSVQQLDAFIYHAGLVILGLLFLFVSIGFTHSVIAHKELWFTIALAEALRRNILQGQLSAKG